MLVFLNNDTEVVEADWAETLLEEALRPEVGAVAPMLLYPDGTVQHAGAALGLHGYAGHPFAGLAPGSTTPFGRADGGTRNWLAVTAACMMVQRSKFEAVGGFDESFVVAGNDVDLCLRLTAAGPSQPVRAARRSLVHDESRSRGAHIDPADFVRSEQQLRRVPHRGGSLLQPEPDPRGHRLRRPHARRGAEPVSVPGGADGRALQPRAPAAHLAHLEARSDRDRLRLLPRAPPPAQHRRRRA